MGNKITIRSLEMRLRDWSVYGDVEHGFELSGYSPAGENIVLSLRGNTLNEIADCMQQYLDDFDAEDHATQIYHEKHYGSEEMQRFYADAPDDFSDLLEDAHAIEDMINDAIGKLRNAAKKNRLHDRKRKGK